METIVLSLGGSIILSNNGDISFLKKLINLLKKLSKKYRLYLVIGGGKTARTYIKIGRDLGLDEKLLDELGIDVTRINAKLLTNLLSVSNEKIPYTTDDAKKIDENIVIMGGTTPGHSTDMVAAELAEKTKADRLVIATNVDGIYDKDPNKFNDAKQLKTVKIEDLVKKYGTNWEAAGSNVVVDGPALEIIQRTRTPTLVVNGTKLDQLEKAVDNESFIGTIILV